MIERVLANKYFEWGIIAVILLNAVTLGLETYPGVMTKYGSSLLFLDALFLSIFVVELILKLYAYRGRFFRNGWNVFDFIIVGIALVPASGPFAVLRALRILRVLRLISVVPALRRVVDAFVRSLGGLASVGGILLVVFYVGAVMSTKLFGEGFPEFFGSIERSLYSLFQIMTLESWSMGIARPVMEVYPYAWLFFVPFILTTTFAVLNLLIGIVVNSMQEIHDQEQADLKKQLVSQQQAIGEQFETKIERIETLLSEMKQELVTKNKKI
jgi:voltage-gated sodium channel